MSSFKLKRSAARYAETVHPMLVFCVQQDWFALPIYAVQKVVEIDNLYGAGSDSTAGLALYQNQKISVIDVEQRIYRRSSQKMLSSSGSPSSQTTALYSRFLVVVLNPQGEPVGLPLDSPPTLQRITESAFAPLPATYLLEGNLCCVAAVATPSSDAPPIFVLNLNQLFQAAISLPASN